MVEIIEILLEHQSKIEIPRTQCVSYVVFFRISVLFLSNWNGLWGHNVSIYRDISKKLSLHQSSDLKIDRFFLKEKFVPRTETVLHGPIALGARTGVLEIFFISPRGSINRFSRILGRFLANFRQLRPTYGRQLHRGQRARLLAIT